MKTNTPQFKHNNGFTKVGKVLPGVSKQYNLDKAVLRHKVLKSWQGVISGFFEEGLSQTKAIDFTNGRLTIACLSQTLGYEIKVLASRIIYAINSFLGKNLVYALSVEY